MPLTKSELRNLIPHSGSMCLLDTVTGWDESTIACETRTHRDPANPLRSHGRLPAVMGIEYAAQAMAVHCALMEVQETPRSGFLASVRNVRFHVEFLDTLGDVLSVNAVRLGGDPRGFIYEFHLASGPKRLMEGRVVVMQGEKQS